MVLLFFFQFIFGKVDTDSICAHLRHFLVPMDLSAQLLDAYDILSPRRYVTMKMLLKGITDRTLWCKCRCSPRTSTGSQDRSALPLKAMSEVGPEVIICSSLIKVVEEQDQIRIVASMAVAKVE